MTHVGIQRFAARDAKKHPAEHQEAGAAGIDHEANRVARIEGCDDAGMMRDGRQPQDRNDDEPQQHHRPEGAADFFGAEALRREQAPTE